MTQQLAVVLLNGPGDAGPTLASVHAEVDDGVPIVRLGGVRVGDTRAAPPEVSAAQAADAAEILAFIRTGDRWRPNALAARLRPLAAHPTAVLGVAGHVLVNRDGKTLRDVPAPMPPFDAADLLLHPRIEASAVLVRASALDDVAMELLARPHGDAALWSGLVREHGLLPSREIAADVALDAARHGHAPQERTDALIEAVRSLPSVETAGAAVLRRELLRRIYIEPDAQLDRASDLWQMLGASPDTDTRPIVEDLQWALERQHESLAAERVRWAYGEVAPNETLPSFVDEDLTNARLEIERLFSKVVALRAEIARLESEIHVRDSQLRQLRDALSGATAP